MSKTRIIDAVKALDTAAVKALVDAKPELLHVRDQQDRGLLHLACSVHEDDLRAPAGAATKLVNYLLDRGLDIEDPIGKDKCPVLFFAVARSRSTPLVKLLLKRGARANNAPGGCLFAAGWYDDVENLKLLIAAGADIEHVAGVTPFLASWGWRKFAAAKCLALAGADVNFQDKNGKTALLIGVEKEFDPGQLKWLVQHGALPDVADKSGVSAREKASRKRNKKWLEALA